MTTQEKILPFFRRVPAPVKLKLLSLWMLQLAVAAASVWVIFVIVTYEDRGPAMPAAVPLSSFTRDEAVPAFTYPFVLSSVAIPLVDKKALRTGYAQFSVVFDMPSPAAIREIELNRVKVLNALNEVAVQFNFEDFTTPSGFTRFKTAYLAALKGVFKENAPRTIAIRDWIIN